MQDGETAGLHTVLVLGGYGYFGAYLCRALAYTPGLRLLIAGRSQQKAQQYAAQLGLPASSGLRLEAGLASLAGALRELQVNSVIHAAGPFQEQDYRVARACIEAGCHYLDLADGRDFVAGIGQLDGAARHAGVLVASGASAVPALSAAVVDTFLTQFSRLDSIRAGIVTGGAPGLATLRAVLGYCGRPFTRLEDGMWKRVYGWQGLQRRHYPQPVGLRWLGNCDVPDLAVLPQRYPGVRTVTFQAGLGNPLSHLVLWGLSWGVRYGWVRNLASWAVPLHWLSRGLERLGTGSTAMHVEMAGVGQGGVPLVRTWHILAPGDAGPNIPCGGAIALVRKLATGVALPSGARPAAGLLTLDEYLATLQGLDIRQVLS